MGAVEEGIQALSRAVTQRVRENVDQVLADAHARANEVREQARQQADAEHNRILHQATREAERIRSQAVASAQLEGRTRALDRREKLLNDVFEAAHKRMPAIQQWTDYRSIVYHLASEAIAQLKSEHCLIRADARTLEILSQGVLDELARDSETGLELGPALDGATGVLVETPDGHRQYDNTLAARLERLQGELRFPVYRLLMGESL